MRLRMLRPTPSAWMAVALFGLARLFFLGYSEAFNAFPETPGEHMFYMTDLECKASPLAAQVVLQGTSRLLPLRGVPLGPKWWHTKDRFSNISKGHNTYWDMLLLHRRNPGLLDHAKLWVLDIVPFQMKDVREGEVLFLRESTLAEKFRVGDPLRRLQALTDWLVPIWSEHHRAANWWRALRMLRASPQDRFAEILRMSPYEFSGERAGLAALNNAFGTHEKVLSLMAFILYREGPPSRVQLAAFRELLSLRPPSAELVLIHLPVRSDLAATIRSNSAWEDSKDALKRFAESAEAPHVHVDWYDADEGFGVGWDSFGNDGVHFSESGQKKIVLHLVKLYKELIPLDATQGEPAAAP